LKYKKYWLNNQSNKNNKYIKYVLYYVYIMIVNENKKRGKKNVE